VATRRQTAVIIITPIQSIIEEKRDAGLKGILNKIIRLGKILIKISKRIASIRNTGYQK
jgi:hypothetical protein